MSPLGWGIAPAPVGSRGWERKLAEVEIYLGFPSLMNVSFGSLADINASDEKGPLSGVKRTSEFPTILASTGIWLRAYESAAEADKRRVPSPDRLFMSPVNGCESRSVLLQPGISRVHDSGSDAMPAVSSPIALYAHPARPGINMGVGGAKKPLPVLSLSTWNVDKYSGKRRRQH